MKINLLYLSLWIEATVSSYCEEYCKIIAIFALAVHRSLSTHGFTAGGLETHTGQFFTQEPVRRAVSGTLHQHRFPPSPQPYTEHRCIVGGSWLQISDQLLAELCMYAIEKLHKVLLPVVRGRRCKLSITRLSRFA